MFTLREPTEAQLIQFLMDQENEPFSYRELGSTRGESPAGFDKDRLRVCLGHGREVFENAKAAIRQWKMFPPEMASLFWPDKPIEDGTIVGVMFRAGPMWSLNPCRIVYTINESGDEMSRFGFAYGTLPEHLEKGEERFCVEWHAEDDSVWYELLAHSRPKHLLAWCGYPIVRFEQARFRRLSGLAMKRAVTVNGTEQTCLAT